MQNSMGSSGNNRYWRELGQNIVNAGKNVVNTGKKFGAAGMTILGGTVTTVNGITSLRKQDQDDYILKTKAKRQLSKKKTERQQYLEVSSLTNESKEEAQEFLRKEGQLTATERIEDTCEFKGPLLFKSPCPIPGITRRKRKLINDSKKESNGTSPLNGEVKTPSQSQQENSDGSASRNEKVTTSAEESRFQVPVALLSNIGEVESDTYNHSFSYYSRLPAVEVSVAPRVKSTQSTPSKQESMRMQTGPPTEVFSVRGPVPIWSDITLCFVVIASTYIFVIPHVEKATFFVRRRLNLLRPTNLTDDSDVLVTPCINNLNNKILINPVKIISRYNEKKLTLNQARLLLKKSFLFNKNEIEILLETDFSTSF